MTRSKKSKFLALAVCLAMLVMAVPFSASAAASLTINGIEKSAPDANGLVSIKVAYTASAEVEQVTILAVKGLSEAPAAAETNIKYIDQQAASETITFNNAQVTGFEFVVDKDDFSAADPNLFIKLGGTALNSATPGQNPVVIAETSTTFKVYGYVNVPAAVGATASLGEGLSATTDADGKFTIENVDAGTYNLTINAKSALERTIPVTVVDADVEVSLVTNKISLMFGDTDGNGKIELDDLLAIKGTFNKLTTDTGYNAAYDLDSNGKIELDDLLAIKGNFNKLITNYPAWVK